jgi:hypothetical protein
MSITVTPANATLAHGATLQYTATGNYSDNSTQDLTNVVTWASTDTSVASISDLKGSKGLATGLTAGMTTISATFGSGATAITGSTTLNVNDVTLLSIAVTPANASIARLSTLQYTATGLYSDSSLRDLTNQATWASTNTMVAAISNQLGSKGVATGLTMGGTVISATVGAVKGFTSLTVTNSMLTSITVAPALAAIATRTTLQYTATGHYADNTTQDLTQLVSWVSTDTSVATITSPLLGLKGLATGVGAGMTTIQATLAGVTGTAMLTVNAVTLVSISVTPQPPLSIPIRGTVQLTATATFSDNSTQDVTQLVSWFSSHPPVASVSNTANRKGLVTGLTPGMSTITAAMGGTVAILGTTVVTVTP